MKYFTCLFRTVCLLIITFALVFLPINSPDHAYAATSCKVGTKLGKTPISLKIGDKPGCYNIKLAAAAKKLLTTDASKSCKLCHANSSSLFPIAHVKSTNANLRTQGYTLKPASITAAFNAHKSQMMNATIKSSDAKAISNYLQSIK